MKRLYDDKLGENSNKAGGSDAYSIRAEAVMMNLIGSQENENEWDTRLTWHELSELSGFQIDN